MKVTSSSVLVFTIQRGARTPIHRRGNGGTAEFVIGSDSAAEKISPAELIDRIELEPGAIQSQRAVAAHCAGLSSCPRLFMPGRG